MKKNTSILITYLALGALIIAPFRVSAQTTGIQKVLESAKQTIDDFVSAKDDQQSMELPLRIKTLEQAMSLSIEEAKDLRDKLNDLDNLGNDEKAWRNEKVKEIKVAITYFESSEKKVEDESDTLSEADTKKAAENFKQWRNDNYLPVLNEVQNYFLIAQQDKTIQTTKKRWQKIDGDIKRLEKAKVKKIDSARKLLTDADGLIEESDTLNQSAKAIFFDTFITPTTSTATSSNSTNSTSSDTKISSLSEDINTTSTDTVSGSADTQPKSIEDLVTDSLSKIKETYKIFIDMSSLVRKLLK